MYDMRWDSKDERKNEVLQYVKNNGKNGIVYIEYSYKQIGLDEEWFREISAKIGDPLVVKREILLQRLRGSSQSPFDQNDIEYIVNLQRKPIDEIYLLDTFRVDVYEELNKRTPYIVGIDCSTGTMNDYNAITVMDPYEVRPVAEFKCSYIGETLFEELITQLVMKHIPKAIVCIERNHVGDSILDHLFRSPINHRLYFDKDKDLVNYNLEEESKVVSMLKKQALQKKYYGVYTEGNSRDAMMAILTRHVKEYKNSFVTQNITEDLARLIKRKSGKIEAGDGFHDDSVMSFLIALYVYYHGNNLAAFGFIKGSKEIENQNQGMQVTLEVAKNEGILPATLVNKMQRQEEMKKENDYAEIYRKALLESQRASMVLHNRGLANNFVIDATPDAVLEDNMDDGEIDMTFFDELNGL